MTRAIIFLEAFETVTQLLINMKKRSEHVDRCKLDC